MEGGGEKKQPGISSGGAGEVRARLMIADVLSSNRDEASDANPTSVISSVIPPDARVTERQKIAGRRSIPCRFRPPAPKQYDVSKKQSTNKEVEEEGSRTSATDESMTDTTFVTSSVHYGGRHYHSSLVPTDPPREPTIDELFSGEINPDVAYRGDWWRGGLYY